MLSRPYSYLFSLSYYGARFKGWAKQKGQPTVEGKLERVLGYVLGHDDFRIIGSSRTDSGVNCRRGFVQIFLREKVDLGALLPSLNQNLSGEIHLGSVQEVARDFNLIQFVERKTYRYFFASAENFHPFASAYITQVDGFQALESMQESASAFVGKHDFRAFCKVTPNKTDFVREVLEAKVYLSDDFVEGFFPEKVYCFEVTGTGFLYHQVRKMVSAVWAFSPQEIQDRLASPEGDWAQVPTAPAHGLVLWETVLRSL
ncbi:tRNA pseudouridine(38-40) synthase TruA [Algoriphagus sp. H41]|uniref:tRNA pseudouridine synthase A n=1 Tax=Algoriphagus oliviformis TaxID=2811231 RepID=A0ABS3C876_9BACT|nr:tRNA pseudouridine(38-40) synthase TruA [Algoriphagus oliviformis]MBN7813321.1 tRNA pseudouridine(38-40) synthase TruA [Algoriphagus oliviformis]